MIHKTMSTFKQQVITFIKKIPKGKVASYGQVAAAAGSPRSARQVGAILRSLDTLDNQIPWWRVLNNKGIISIKGNWTATKQTQKKLLEQEGIKINKDFSLDMEKYRY